MGLAVTVVACLGVAGFLSFAETCLTSLSESKVHAIINAGGRHARALGLWMDHPHEVLVTILVANNIASTLVAALVTRMAMLVFDQAALSIAVGVTSLLIIMFGEITPKTLGRRYAHRAAVPTIVVLSAVHAVLRPLTWALTRVARSAVQVFGGDLDASRDVTEDEIEALVDLGRREGSLQPAKADTLRAVFRMSYTTTREIMVPRTDILAVDLDLPPADFVLAVDTCGHTRVPVYRGTVDDIVGVLHAKDLLHHMVESGTPRSAAEIEALLREPLFVPETMRADTLLRFFRKSRQHLAVVVDEFGGTAGVTTLEDVLEELVGEIWDEHDQEEPVIVRRGPGRWTADGRIPLSVVEEKLGLELPEDRDYDTLAGLLLELAGNVPRVGSTHETQGYRFEVLTGDEKRVGLVRATKIDAAEHAAARP
jgi:CBS domain containing-hemolysin-like protein